MDIKRLELLRELSERGTVGAVADATGVTPSAVSQQLKVLEQEAGTPLTEPAGRGIALTVAGRALVQTATEIAIAVERAESRWHDFMKQPAGEVTLTTFPTGGEMLLPQVLARLVDVPGLRLVCTDQDPLLPDFADLTPDFDIVLADSPVNSPSWRDRGLLVVPLMSEPLDVALPESHRLAKKTKLTPKDLAGEIWIGAPADFPYDRILQEIEAVNGVPAIVAQRFMDNGIVESMVAGGQGIAILPRYTTRDRGNGLITRPLAGVRTRRDISALMRPDRAERPSVQLVVETLKQEAQKLAASHTQAAG
ncbi:MAG: LysR family transcriptional regulator [Kineosporiaceae bacterium]|nr:LysR family transcriptional regulator [Aeromicrobium sp.]